MATYWSKIDRVSYFAGVNIWDQRGPRIYFADVPAASQVVIGVDACIGVRT